MFYAGEDEMHASAVKYMETAFADVRLIDITAMSELPPGLGMRGYQIKPFSILLSSFEEVLFLDADDYPVRDPSIIFDVPAYKKTGALFWPDYCNMCVARYFPSKC